MSLVIAFTLCPISSITYAFNVTLPSDNNEISVSSTTHWLFTLFAVASTICPFWSTNSICNVVTSSSIPLTDSVISSDSIKLDNLSLCNISTSKSGLTSPVVSNLKVWLGTVWIFPALSCTFKSTLIVPSTKPVKFAFGITHSPLTKSSFLFNSRSILLLFSSVNVIVTLLTSLSIPFTNTSTSVISVSSTIKSVCLINNSKLSLSVSALVSTVIECGVLFVTFPATSSKVIEISWLPSTNSGKSSVIESVPTINVVRMLLPS